MQFAGSVLLGAVDPSGVSAVRTTTCSAPKIDYTVGLFDYIFTCPLRTLTIGKLREQRNLCQHSRRSREVAHLRSVLRGMMMTTIAEN